jgi:hypothetical protein
MTDAPTEVPPAKTKRPRRTPAQEMAYLQQRIAKIKTAETERSRRERNHALIVIGGAVTAAMRDDTEWRERVLALLKSNVTRPADLEAISPWLSGI